MHDLNDRLEEAFASHEPGPPTSSLSDVLSAAGPGGSWPVEAADIVVLDATRPLAVCTLGDPDLARRLAARGHPHLAVVGPMATENLGIEKLVRNVVTNAATRTIVLVGPETGGSAPTGHYAGDALLCLLRNGVDTHTKRILEAKGRRPFLKNLSLEDIGLFRGRVSIVDHRGLADPAAISAALEEAAGGLAGLEDAMAGSEVHPPVTTVVPWLEASPLQGFQKDPAGYFVIFCDHANTRLVVEHYTTDDERTLVISGRDPRSLAHAAIQHHLFSTLDHAVYLGRELERAAAALEAGRPYVQDGGGE